MGTPVINLTESQTFAALRGFLLALLPPNTPVVRGQLNRVPEPAAGVFVVMTQISSERLATNTNTYSDLYSSGGASTLSVLYPVKVTMQLDFHSVQDDSDALYNAADCMRTVAAIFRSEYGVNLFQASGYDVTPLHVTDRGQVPYLNAEQQVEERWMLEAELQCNPVIVLPQQFAAALAVNTISVDAVYPPGGTPAPSPLVNQGNVLVMTTQNTQVIPQILVTSPTYIATSLSVLSYKCDCTNNSIAFQLPLAKAGVATAVNVKRADAVFNANASVTFTAAAGQSIWDPASQAELTMEGQSLTFVWDGVSQWYLY